MKSTRFFVLGLILLATSQCGRCNKQQKDIEENPSPTTVPPTPMPIPTQTPGIWHTGTFAYEVKPTPPQNSVIPHLYNHTFHMYRVSHDGSCGFRSFIPILLADILVNNKWQAWLETIKNTYYEPAKPVLKSIKLDQTKKYKLFLHKDPDQLLKDINDLLQKLSQEPKPRPLEENEISLLVDFLRQTILTANALQEHKIITHMQSQGKAINTTLEEGIDKFFTPDRKNPAGYWAYALDFTVYRIFYTGLFKEGNNHKIQHHLHNIQYKCVVDRVPEDPNNFPQQNPPVLLYHHDNIFFDYLVLADEQA